MFCSNCGKEIPNETKFCSYCGAPQGGAVPNPSPSPEAVSQVKPKSNGKFIGGIVMVVVGAMAFLGWMNNGFFENISVNGAEPSDISAILMDIGLLAGGAWMIYKAKKK